MSTNIKTGVDKLVELISEKKKISVDVAAKELGVGKEVVQEWAEFLEEEGIVALDYNLSKTWIVEKKISKDDLLSNAKEVSSEKDAFVRKIEVTINALQQETTGFEDIRREFTNIQGHIKNEIETVKSQLGELERYDSLKKNLDKDLLKQKQEYDTFIKETQEKLKIESQKYDELKSLISKERKNLEQYGQKIDDLKKLRTDYERTISSLKDSLKNIDNVVYDTKNKLEESKKLIYSYTQALDKLDAQLSTKNRGLLSGKFDSLKSGEESLSKKQLQIESDLKRVIGSVQSYAGLGDKVHKSFDGYFSKNINTEKLISEIENDKTDLNKELDLLKTKVLSFTLLTSNANIKSSLKEIEGKLREFERKKLSIRYKIEKLISLIKGK